MRGWSSVKSVIVFLLVFLFGLTFNAISGEHEGKEVHWGYSGETGPQYWGSLKPEFALCSQGKAQSPIDIEKTYKTVLEPIKFLYHPIPLKVINNGHTIQVNSEPGNAIIFNGEKYELVQFHFHVPSEHTIKGKYYDMELHLVHKNKNNEIAVVGVFMKIGRKNKVIQQIWEHIPIELNKEVVVKEISLDISKLLPKSKKYYWYYGSLTTPPCSEGVTWLVLKEPIEVSKDQVEKFKTIMGGNNNRPVQPLNKRFILEAK